MRHLLQTFATKTVSASGMELIRPKSVHIAIKLRTISFMVRSIFNLEGHFGEPDMKVKMFTMMFLDKHAVIQA
ncbi:uncharacterized protein PHALS_00376 [Plasmopara halstedii]|uniref:Uncharacterized protein n=1 Tax=Plasmopara halstedii TaxID=4781 RepID=A0A0P1A7A6_PLAHL|nr:uncharacterized protein PHALS_00376 [Plasmopara halstedii]CEG36056.1 hypothetical protein PHALS_00376 [Plasmopara halstedii]|eukprot:XP_024572425.1 hypothetical protein PHALS_00376 [Plasmopara halstedii]